MNFNGLLDVQLGLTDLCNLECVMCQQTAWRGVYGNAKDRAPILHEGQRGFMTRELFQRFLAGLERHRFTLRVLSLMWVGESLLHPEFPELFADLAETLQRFPVAEHLVLNTNATLFDENVAEAILDYKRQPGSVPMTVVFSLDAASRDKFRRLKGIDLYDNAIRNVEHFLLARREIPADPFRPLTVAVQTLVLPENHDEMTLFRDRWETFFREHDIAWDRCHDTLHGFADTKLYFKRASSASQTEVENLHRETVTELELAHPWLLKQERIVEFDSALEQENPEERRPCPAPFRTATINWDGTVVPCCIDTEMQLPLGNLTETDFPEIIQGPAAQSLRLGHVEGDLVSRPVCLHCQGLHYPAVPDREICDWLTEQDHKDKIRPFMERMKKAGKLRAEKPWRIVRPLDFQGLKQTLIIEAAATCNLRCVMCEQSFDPDRKEKGLMDLELYKRIIDELVETKAQANVVNLFWSGESLVHPKFREMIRYAAEKNRDYQGFGAFDLHTNGNLLTEEIAREMVTGRQFARILISLDAASGETYDQIRRGGSFDRVVDNVKRLVELRRELDGDWPAVTLQYVVSATNRHEVLDFVRLADDIFGAGRYQLNRDWDHPAPFRGDVVFFKRLDELSTEDQLEAERIHREVCLELGLVDAETSARLVDSDEYRVDESGVNPLTGQEAIRRPCVGLFTHMAIRWNGDVTACCRDIKCHLKLGNVGEASLLDLFNSDTLTRMRLQHIEGRADEIPACQGCPNQICPVITDGEVEWYLRSVGRPDLILPYRKRMGSA